MFRKNTFLIHIYRQLTSQAIPLCALMGMLILSILFYIGLQASGTSMTASMNRYYHQQRHPHITLTSTYGVYSEDIQELQSQSNLQVQSFFYEDVQSEDRLLRLFSYDADSSLQPYTLLEGHFPRKAGQIALNLDAFSNYQLGDKIRITLSQEASLYQKEFTITGFISSSLYVERKNLSTSLVGKGFLDGYGLISSDYFDTSIGKGAWIYYKQLEKQDIYSSTYSDFLEKKEEELARLLKDRPQEVLDMLRLKAYQEAADKTDISQLPISIQEEVKANIQKEIDASFADITPPEYSVTLATKESDYISYQDNANRIQSISYIFPLIFFLTTALVSGSIMMRIVSRDRTQIGTLKALGYSYLQISGKYICYGLITYLAGTSLGLWSGRFLLPPMIYSAYSLAYDLPPLVIAVDKKVYFWSALLSFVSIMLPLLWACHQEITGTPALLMRPKPPRSGRKILLEYASFWKRLSFAHKITLRNLFRYKGRNLIAIIGVAGCSTLIMMGFGIRDSLKDLSHKQFKEIFQYQGILLLEDDSSFSKQVEIEQALAKEIAIWDFAPINYLTINALSPKDSIDVTILAGENTLEDFIDYQSMDDKAISLDKGIILTQKLASLLEVETGDRIQLKDDTGKKYTLLVGAISKNYIGHYIYMSKDVYEAHFNQKGRNGFLLSYHDEDFAHKALDKLRASYNQIQVIIYNQIIANAFQSTIDSLQQITLILIIAAALLAFIVLYNLNSITILERIREVSTLMVLGFYHNEVIVYMYRETSLLTLIGICIGFICGNLLNLYVLKRVEVDNMLFPPYIAPISYLYTFLLTSLFSLMMMGIMYRHIRRINMNTSLKSVE